MSNIAFSFTSRQTFQEKSLGIYWVSSILTKRSYFISRNFYIKELNTSSLLLFCFSLSETPYYMILKKHLPLFHFSHFSSLFTSYFNSFHSLGYFSPFSKFLIKYFFKPIPPTISYNLVISAGIIFSSSSLFFAELNQFSFNFFLNRYISYSGYMSTNACLRIFDSISNIMLEFSSALWLVSWERNCIR